jgi:hypothetical protein
MSFFFKNCSFFSKNCRELNLNLIDFLNLVLILLRLSLDLELLRLSLNLVLLRVNLNLDLGYFCNFELNSLNLDRRLT